ncbi:MAG: hypothetical protein JO060_11630 [Candidatus Eremiobacteraeota bacterium]|nr:hypothetical protein [Candidatus Eremiobacteraeota bacterium]MBV9646290.1 hypothetical protein [Candidatus Eremiobacteraeota bacterium]
MNALLFILSAGIVGAVGQAPSTDLLRRAMDPNPGLHSYVASATLSATLHAPIPVHQTLQGKAYYLKPKHKVVFENLSGPLSRFKELTSSTPTYDEARAEYDITPLTDDGKRSEYRFVPTKAGHRVKSLTLVVDDAATQIVRASWTYNDGSELAIEPSYKSVGGFRLPDREAISAHFPGYRADGTLQLSNYQLNVPVPQLSS